MAKAIINGLPQGTILHGKNYDYEIVKALGQGSFSITHLASVKMRGELGSIDATVYVESRNFSYVKLMAAMRKLLQPVAKKEYFTIINDVLSKTLHHEVWKES